MTKIKTLIIDDEPLARKRISQLLATVADFQIIGESGNGADALSACRALRPDLIFLDVKMPDETGFDVLEKLPKEHTPAIVFVTAYDQYTIKAFDFYAVDYLLKPFSVDRFRLAVEKVRERFKRENDADLNRQIIKLLDHFKTNRDYLDRLIINHKDRLIVVPVKDIDWIAAYGNYVRVHSQGKTYLLRETIGQLTQMLDPEKFLRIHRSTIVSAERIREFQPMFGGQYTVVLKDGSEFVLSRNYRKEVLSRFE